MIRITVCISFFALLFCILVPLAVRAQQNGAAIPAAVSDDTTSRVSPDDADVAISATVHARELTFQVIGDGSVTFPGSPGRDTVVLVERQNLPKPVTAGVTYRDIGIRLTIVSAFADIDRIVAGALHQAGSTEENGSTPSGSSTQPGGEP
jgi:hypothetical protein